MVVEYVGEPDKFKLLPKPHPAPQHLDGSSIGSSGGRGSSGQPGGRPGAADAAPPLDGPSNMVICMEYADCGAWVGGAGRRAGACGHRGGALPGLACHFMGSGTPPSQLPARGLVNLDDNAQGQFSQLSTANCRPAGSLKQAVKRGAFRGPGGRPNLKVRCDGMIGDPTPSLAPDLSPTVARADRRRFSKASGAPCIPST